MKILMSESVVETAVKKKKLQQTGEKKNWFRIPKILKKKKPKKKKKINPENIRENISNLDLDSLRRLVSVLIILAYFRLGNTISVQQEEKITDFVRETIPFIEEVGLAGDLFVDIFNEVMETYSIENVQNKTDAFLKQVFTYQKSFENNPNVPPALKNLFNDARLMANGSGSAAKRIKNSVGLMKSPMLTSLFIDPIRGNTQGEFLKPLEALVKKLGGEGKVSPWWLNIKEMKAAGDRGRKDSGFEETRQDYLRIRREAVEKAKKFAQAFIRSNKNADQLADYESLIEALDRNNIKIHNFSTGFKGFINDRFCIYTETGLPVKGSPRNAVITMNPKYDPETDNAYVFRSYVDGALTTTRYYTESHRAQSKEKTFETVESLSNDIDRLRKKWRSKISTKIKKNKNDHDEDLLSAMIVEIIYQTQARIGNPGNQSMVDGEYRATFGITTIKCKDIRKRGDGIHIIYRGKKQGQQKHVLKKSQSKATELIIARLLKWKNKREPEKAVFQTASGLPISSIRVNKFLEKMQAPKGVTAHKFRHLKGMYMMSEILESHPWKKKSKKAKSSAEVTTWLKKEAMAIGETLGHFSGETTTPNTALANYCPPGMMLGLYRDASVSIPVAMARIAGLDPLTLESYGVKSVT